MSPPGSPEEWHSSGQGHFVTFRPGHRVEAFFVDLAVTPGHGPRQAPGTDPGPDLERGDLVFMLAVKQRDWRSHRSTAPERAQVLSIGGRLELRGLRPAHFATTSFGISAKTYRRWKRSASA